MVTVVMRAETRALSRLWERHMRWGERYVEIGMLDPWVDDGGMDYLVSREITW